MTRRRPSRRQEPAYWEVWVLCKTRAVPEGVWACGGKSRNRDDLAEWESDPDAEFRPVYLDGRPAPWERTVSRPGGGP